MQVFLIILSVILLGVIINYAFSVKSSRILKLAAIGALVLIALSIGVATIVIVLNNFKQVNEEEQLPIFLEAQRAAPNTGNLVEIIISLAILAFLIILVAVAYSRERKKMLAEAKKAGSRRFPSAAQTSDTDQEAEEAPAKAKDGEFDLDL
ncbi:MAG: hypothetical protein LBQ94_00085 [Treponema sp.]|jgi:cbb3-type cytochrome oxidase subunit 3|nr:hypothetical protein [Treponema sp.]